MGITEVSNMFSWTFVSSFFRKSENMASENSEKMASENSLSLAIENSEKLVGKTMEEADEMIQNEEIIHDGEIITEIRPMKVDEEGMLGTCDYRTDRINVETENGKIVKLLGTN